MGLAQLIRTRVENNFGTKLNVKGTYSVYQLNQALRIHPDTKLIITTVPVRLSSQGMPIIGDPPGFAEHNREVLSSLGYSEEEIAGLSERGILFGEK